MEEGENQPCASADISEKVAPEKYPSADISEKVAPEEYPSADISEKKVAPEEYPSADISEKVAPEKYPSADISEKVAPEEYPSADISEKKVAPEEYLRDVPKLAQLTDRFGNTFKFGNAGDYWHQAFPIGSGNDYRRHVKQIREMEIRDDDVLICSYPKTGLHWHMEIVRMLMDRSAEMRKHLFSAICFIDSKSIDSFSSTESPRLLVTHVPFRHIPKQALKKKIKIIYLDRNPKDVLVSYYNHMHKHVAPLNYPGTFEQFFHLSLEVGYLYGNIFDYAMEWQNGRDKYTEVNFFISVYEDMKSDPVGGVKKLNTYLGTGCSDQLCEQIGQVSCFDNVKSHRDANTPAMFEALFVDNKLGIYRKGEVGDWKNWFTVAMNEEFEEEYKKRMSEYRTVYKYSL